MSSYLALAGFFVASFAAASSGAIFRPGRWYYEELIRPSWNPPAWLFAPAWTVFYTIMSIAAWLVWSEGGWSGLAGIALAVFFVHLVLNAAWSYFFFHLERPDLAFFEVIALWVGVATTLVLFWMVRPLAGALLIPYLGWVTFASYLNFTIWRLNIDADWNTADARSAGKDRRPRTPSETRSGGS